MDYQCNSCDEDMTPADFAGKLAGRSPMEQYFHVMPECDSCIDAAADRYCDVS